MTLIEEARAITDYDSNIYTDSEFQELVDIGREEIRAETGSPELSFYTSDTFQATRALFWFTCIAAKVRAGEIAGVNLTVESIEAAQPGNENYAYWFRNFGKRIRAAAGATGPASIVLSRTERSYGDQ